MPRTPPHPFGPPPKTMMAHTYFHSPIALISLPLFSTALLFFPLFASPSPDPVPAPWPLQFHSIIFVNNSKGHLQVVDLWYDWPNGRNFNIIQNQLGKKLYDLEWTNGTSYYYTLDENKECTTRHFPVGILRPNWLDGANYLGQEYKDGFLCNVWEKVDFIWYYEDVETKRPVYWAFYSGRVHHVMTFEVGEVLDDPNWQAPVYCFEDSSSYNKHKERRPSSSSLELQHFDLPLDPMKSFMRERFHASSQAL